MDYSYKSLFVFVFLTVFIYSCNRERELPIEEDKLVQVLADIHIAESALKDLTGPEKDSAANKLYNQIYTIHNVAAADVDTCLFHLKRDPVKIEAVYAKVLDELNSLKVKKDEAPPQ